ncbi:hypothetical protein BKA70DRAFT_1227595 [Coprinopsis sp. MPI-PUGE-AT-0042]|nr:hypothetical protein BKA70DRAFT_1227595 [Coprinopsis sp. MPI-PUGE-AT-0042]
MRTGDATPGHQLEDAHAVMIVADFGGGLENTPHAMDLGDHFRTWRGRGSNAVPASSINHWHRNLRNRTYPRQEGAELSAYSTEEIIQRKNLIIAHQRRKIKQLEERLLEMRRLYMEDEMEALYLKATSAGRFTGDCIGLLTPILRNSLVASDSCVTSRARKKKEQKNPSTVLAFKSCMRNTVPKGDGSGDTLRSLSAYGSQSKWW